MFNVCVEFSVLSGASDPVKPKGMTREMRARYLKEAFEIRHET